MAIHSTAIVPKTAEIDSSCEIGPYAVIGPRVRMAADNIVGAHAVIEGDTTIGKKNHIFQFAAIGAIPQDLKYGGEPTRLEIGDGNQIREFATIHIGTAGGGGVTRIGNGCLFMAYSHVAHDCQIGEGCILANCAALAGHVQVEAHVVIAGLSAVHQFTRIGRHAFIAGGSMVAMDIPPYCTAQGDRAVLAGLNTVGLKRHGYTDDQVSHIKSAYKILFRSRLGLREGLARVKAEFGGKPEIDHLVGFIEGSERGITRQRGAE
jgi:UDP-N-acetylglucosamine acyltransferase